jgi:serine protease Do
VPGQPDSGYAGVVQKILPSVVSIGTYSKTGTGRFRFDVYPDDLNRVPPLFRDFLEDWLGQRDPGSLRERRRPGLGKPVQTGLGSGVIITSDGYILTNNHVVDQADELKVEIAGKGRNYSAKVIGNDPQTDVALLKIEADGLTPATIGDSAKLRVGDVLLAVGSPMGLEQSVTHGIVSGLSRSDPGILSRTPAGQPGYENFIQTDAAINPGNSGGPLLDAKGRVVGLNTAIETRSGMFAGIGLAIPINMAVSVTRDLLENGKVPRGFLGIEMDKVDASIADYLGLERGTGVMINSVLTDSPAAKAGFQEGDAIVSIDDQKITTPAQLRLIVSSYRPGTEVKFQVIRYNQASKRAEPVELKATLQPLPDKPGSQLEDKPARDGSAQPEKSLMKGVTIENLNEEIRQDYDIPDDVEGVAVVSVDQNSIAAGVLEEGDVIVQINRQPVRNVTEAIASKDAGAAALQLKILHNGRVKFVILNN